MSSEMGQRVWREESLLALESDEHDFQEFKGSALLAEGGTLNGAFLATLSKQVSAFANGAGGRLFIGLDDHGRPDGGVPTQLIRGGTRAWLEDVIGASVDPPLQRFNVFEVPSHGGADSLILPDHAVYVIDLPASERAPHQASDYRYYLRIAGKSRPMGHVHVQDVLRRTQHPVVCVDRVTPYGSVLSLEEARGQVKLLCLQIFVVNRGQHMAQHVGIELILPRALVGGLARQRSLSAGDLSLSQRPGELIFFRYHPSPVFPSQKLRFARVWVALHAHNARAIRSQGAGLSWRLYADDAPPSTGHAPLWRFAQTRLALRGLKRTARAPAAD